MKITVNRSEKRLPGTAWRPLEYTLRQREVIESVRRTLPEGITDKVIRRSRTVDLSALDLLLAGGHKEDTEARIEDPYRRGHYLGGYVYVRSLAAFVHEKEVDWARSRRDAIGPGSVVSQRVRIEEGARIGPFVELEKGAVLRSNAHIQARSVIRKNAQIGPDAVVGPGSYVGQGAMVKNRVRIGEQTVLGKNNQIDRDAALGAHVHADREVHVRPDARVRPWSTLGQGVFVGSSAIIGEESGQVRLGRGTTISSGACLGDSVRIGANSFVGLQASIGEMTVAGDHLHVGEGSFVGAESRFGDFVRVARRVILASPTFAEDGEVLTQTNMAMPLRFFEQDPPA